MRMRPVGWARALLVAAWAGAVVAAQGTETVFIGGGRFVMGTDPGRVAELRMRYAVAFPGVFENETPARLVTVDAFRLDRHEVTNAAFAAFLAARPEWRKARLSPAAQNGRYLSDWSDEQAPAGRERHPVVFVTWHAAQAFCRWAGGRLPTEAEWEYAARGGGDAEFPWGDDLPAPDRANYARSGHGAPVPVGTHVPALSGLHDMAGNVWEWLLDAWEERHPAREETNPIRGGAVGDAALQAVQGRRAIRGGSFGGGVVNLRTRWRDSHVVTNAVEFVGFRCAYPAG